MYRLALFFYGLSLFQFLSAQELICPANVTKTCYNSLDDKPQIIDGAGLILDSSREFRGSTCSVYHATNTYRLINPVTDSVVSTCTQKIIITPLEEAIVFPRDTTVSGYRVAEIYNESVLLEGMFPFGDNDCNIRYTFNDVLVESFPLMYIFRHWEAYNWCTEETTKKRQRIVLDNIPNGSISTTVYDCPGELINIDSIEIYHQGRLVTDQSYCFDPFRPLYQLLNCLADSLLVDDNDDFVLELSNISNPLRGVGIKDRVDIRRHILGLKRFKDACRLSAADVNKDGKINGIDLVEITKLFLGVYTEWPAGGGPELYINGEPTDDLILKKTDFPLDKLEITVVNQGNTSTK